MTYRKKLIEVALPLEAINVASAREKSIRHGHPSTLHLWWSRKPLATCRAVLFASLVDDPSSRPEEFPTEGAQERERQRLFRLIEELVKWENTNNEQVLAQARAEILKSTDGNPPPVLDPFCGGGSIPLEAQRLGLEAHASDLNPVAVLITKALIEIPPKFAGCPPVNPKSRAKIGHADGWHGARGLAEDVRYYGDWMRGEAWKRIGHLYPKVSLPLAYGGGEATVIAWLWARTVKCPNPACGAQMPLVRSFRLSLRKGNESWVKPIVNGGSRCIAFEVGTGTGTAPEGTVNRRGAACLVCETNVPLEHIRAEGKTGRMGAQLMAIIAEGVQGRVFLPPSTEHEAIAACDVPIRIPETSLPEKALGFRVQLYGLTHHRDLFTPRQLLALATFSNLVSNARERVGRDASAAGLVDDGVPPRGCATGAAAYADAVATYLGLAVSKAADLASTICHWAPNPEHLHIAPTFARHALPMSWEFAEGNPFSDSTGNFGRQWELIEKVLGNLGPTRQARVLQRDATQVLTSVEPSLISTDPPYYDNIGYADLSDFFYVWLRQAVGTIYPETFGTVLTPKSEELIAAPERFDGERSKAKSFFETGLNRAFAQMQRVQHPNYPLTVYYAFKQSETDEAPGDSTLVPIVASTGWETMLEGLLRAGFQISGTWPMRTERPVRSRSIGSNALASSIVLVCRPRPETAPRTTRRELIAALKRELPDALRKLQHGNIAPVDLAQAAIGPGMAVFSRYSRVLEADGTPMSVRAALGLINQALDEVLAEQEGEFDGDTRWAVAWFEQRAMAEGVFGEADVLARAKNTSVQGLVSAGILEARAGKVRLLGRGEFDPDWKPASDGRRPVWEVAQHLIRALEQHGESGAAGLLRTLGGDAEAARDLAYRLYGICERKGWAQEALAYNSLVVAWPEIVKLAHAEAPVEEAQVRLPGLDERG